MRRIRLKSRPTISDSVTVTANNASKKNEFKKRRTKVDNDSYSIEDNEYSKGRPFQIIEKLPCSLEAPMYDLFTHALSVKDSAVLYNSLLSSRRTWIKAEMFELFWSKQYMNVKDRELMLEEGIDPDEIDQSAAREKMNKLCDAIMTGGPHRLPIRMFILKDDNVETKWQAVIESKRKEKELKRKHEAQEKEQRREERKRLQLVKKEEKQKKTENSKREKERRKKLQEEGQGKSRKVISEYKQLKNAESSNYKSFTLQFSKTQQQEIENQKMIANLNMMAQQDSALNKLMVAVANGVALAPDVERFKTFIDKARSMDPPLNWKPKLVQNNLSKKYALKNTGEPSTISYRNSKISIEPELNKKGDFTSEASSCRSSASIPNIEPEIPVTATVLEINDINISSTPKKLKARQNSSHNPKPEPSKIRLDSGKTVVKIANLKPNELNSPVGSNVSILLDTDNSKASVLESNPSITKQENSTMTFADSSRSISGISEIGSKTVDKSLDGIATVDQHIYKDEGASSVKPKRKYTKRKKEFIEEEDKSMQLTIFQQKYIEGADIVFEYLENINMRYLFSKNSILEPLEDGESYLMSWIIIHNKKEIEEFRTRRLKEINKYRKKSSVTEKQKEEENEQFNVYDDPKCPPPSYTPMTVTLSKIPKKFTPIILNSVNPPEKVQAFMSMIIERGQRLTGYNLWFQLDAYEDKDLAEYLRAELNDYEQGFKSKRQRKQI